MVSISLGRTEAGKNLAWMGVQYPCEEWMSESGKLVLLVEDNEDNRIVYSTILKHFGYSVIDKLAHWRGKPQLNRVNNMIIARLMRLKPKDADLVVFGHSHKPCAEQIDGTLYFNPGSTMGAGSPTITVVPPSIGFLSLAEDGSVSHEWVAL